MGSSSAVRTSGRICSRIPRGATLRPIILASASPSPQTLRILRSHIPDFGQTRNSEVGTSRPGSISTFRRARASKLVIRTRVRNLARNALVVRIMQCRPQISARSAAPWRAKRGFRPVSGESSTFFQDSDNQVSDIANPRGTQSAISAIRRIHDGVIAHLEARSHTINACHTFRTTHFIAV